MKKCLCYSKSDTYIQAKRDILHLISEYASSRRNVRVFDIMLLIHDEIKKDEKTKKNG